MTTSELVDRISEIRRVLLKYLLFDLAMQLDQLIIDIRSAANIAGDGLCWMDDSTKACPLPRDQMLESCRRFVDQKLSESGPLQIGQMTIAQLESALHAKKS